MNSFKKITGILLFLIALSMGSFAQTVSDEVEMADIFQKDGKIYVVIAVLTVVLIGLLVYLISIDRKVSKLEKKLGDRKS